MNARRLTIDIYRYDPEQDAPPRLQRFVFEPRHGERMLLDALVGLKRQDPTLAFRRSCREGVCGSDGMNINGRNGLACLTPLAALPDRVVIKPLPGVPVIRDLMVDLSSFFHQYHSITPYLVNDGPPPERERLQTPAQRDELDGLYECILCACCSTADSRDEATRQRLDDLEDPYRLFRCRTIMNCVDVCPKGLDPAGAISRIRSMLGRRLL